jgi:hypothetical protein
VPPPIHPQLGPPLMQGEHDLSGGAEDERHGRR